MDGVPKDALKPTDLGIEGQQLTRLNKTRIRQELEKPSKLDRLPGVDILANQFDRNYDDILRKVPNSPRQQIAFNLATRFFNLSLYQRISEQAMFGPKDYERFDDPRDAAPLMQQIGKDLADAQRNIASSRPSARITTDNGWLYVDQGKHKTDYRIYLSPEPKAVGKIFSEVALAIPEGTSYQMKTFDRPSHPLEVSRLDKIIVYCSETNFDEILEAVEGVYNQNEATFKGRPGPGGGTISPLEGLSIIRQPDKGANGQELTGTQLVADLIGGKLKQQLPQITRAHLSKFQNARQASQSDEGKMLWSVMQLDQETIARFWYAGNDQLRDDQRNALATIYLQTLWGTFLYYYAESKPFSGADLRKSFLKAIQGKIQITPSQTQYLMRANMSELQNDAIQDRMVKVIQKTGLALALEEGLNKGQTAGVTFKKLLAA